jgi:hypothetical protein
MTHSLGSGISVVSDCLFTGLKTGVEVRGDIPLIRRSIFEKSSEGVHVYTYDLKETVGDISLQGSLGDVTDANSGYNQFTGFSETVLAVTNDRPEAIKCQNNYWGTNDEASAWKMIQGTCDLSPVLTLTAKGSGLVPASAYCNLWDSVSRDPVTEGKVGVAPGSYNSMTQNTKGVYAFVCLPPGSFSFDATATDYLSLVKSAALASGDTKSLLFPLNTKSATVEGELPLEGDGPGEGETATDGEGVSEGEGDTEGDAVTPPTSRGCNCRDS